MESLRTNPVENLEVYDPFLFVDETKMLIDGIHAPEYISALKTGTPQNLAESQGFDWDSKIWDMAVAHSSGLVAGTDYAIEEHTQTGSLSSGLHHARRGFGGGFCTINGLAVAAQHAINKGARRVLIIDFDAHGGGGTWSIIRESMPTVTQVDVSCSPFDSYEPTGDSMFIDASRSEYKTCILKALNYSISLGDFDIIIYNAGMDPLNSGVSIDDIIWRETAVRSFIGRTPAVFALAGGYTWGRKSMDDVVSWHRLTIEKWASETK